jgi:hypothetical protein
MPAFPLPVFTWNTRLTYLAAPSPAKQLINRRLTTHHHPTAPTGQPYTSPGWSIRELRERLRNPG